MQKKIAFISLKFVFLLSVLSLAFAVGISAASNGYAVISQNSVSLRGSSEIFGDTAQNSGKLLAVGNCTVDGTSYITDKVTVQGNIFTTAMLSDEIDIPKALSEFEFPGDDCFENCTYNNGTRNIELVWWNNGQSDKYENNYTLSENAYVDTLTVPNNLTMYVEIPADTYLIIRANNLYLNGNLNIIGGGTLLIYVEDKYKLSNARINVNGSPEKFVLATKNDIKLSSNLRINGTIISNGDVLISSNDVINGNIYAGGDFNVSGNCTVTGAVLAPNSETEISGSSKVYGSLVTNSLKLEGNSLISFKDTDYMTEATLSFAMAPYSEASEKAEDDVKPDVKPDEKPVEDVEKDEVINEPVLGPVENKPDEENQDAFDETYEVIEYDVARDAFTHGTMTVTNYSVPENGAQRMVRYSVFELDSFVPDDVHVEDALIDDILDISDKTNAVFENRKGKIVEERFGRIDSEAYQYSLTISPYVIPALRKTNNHTIWLVWADMAGQVAKVWMSVR